MSNTVRTTARHLLIGDVLVGSGFVVTNYPYTSVRCPKGKIHIDGHYPNGPVRRHTWNQSTTLTIARQVYHD